MAGDDSLELFPTTPAPRPLKTAADASAAGRHTAPLADRMRPRRLEDIGSAWREIGPQVDGA